MQIRLATQNDYLSICRSLQNKGQYWNTPARVKQDVKLNRLYIAISHDKIVGQVALENKPEFGYIGIVRLCVYNKKDYGKGIATALIQYICDLGLENLGGTPFIENATTCNLFEKFGFKEQYTFENKYKFYLKKS